MASTPDLRQLNELAFQAQVQNYGGFANVVVSSDLTKQNHPAGKVKCTDPQEEISPGTGIYRSRVDIDIVFRADAQGAFNTSELLQAIRQGFYRNDLDPIVSRNLAKMLTANVAGLSTPYPYTCLGIVWLPEGPVLADQEDRQYTYRFSFEVHSMPR